MSILDSLLEQLKGSEKKVVGVALTPGIGLEAVILDKTKKQVEKYGRKDVAYNFSQREIQNIAQFKTQFSELMEELEVPAKTEVYIVLPNVLFDFMEAPVNLSTEDLKTIILSKAEEFYLFKRDEPVSGYCEVANPDGGTQKKYAYTSFQKTVIEQIKEVVSDLGLLLIGIEGAYSATLRGLYQTGLLDEVVFEEQSWTMMLINTNSYTLFQMDGKNLLAYSEVPLAIKSFSMEEAYQAIVQSSSQLLSSFQSAKLFIVSQTDDISAEVLKRQMQFDREIVAIDSNKYSKKAPMEVISSSSDFEKTNSLTLAAIGASCPKTDFDLAINILADDPNAKPDVYVLNLTGKEQEFSGSQINAFFVTITVIILIIGAAVLIATGIYNTTTSKKIGEYQDQITRLQKQIDELSKEEPKEEVDITAVIDEIAEQNVTAINFYDSISTDIPKNVWLTKYYNKSGSQLAITGIAESIIDIYEYYKNLRIVSPQSDIKLTELRVVTSDNQSEDESRFISSLSLSQDKDRLYSFAISNTQIEYKDESDGADKNADEYNLLRQAPAANIEATSQQMTVAN